MTETRDSWPFALLEPADDFDAAEFGEMLIELRQTLAALATAAPDKALTRELTADLRRWRTELVARQSSPSDAPYGQLHQAADHGIAALPDIVIDAEAPGTVDATVTFSRWHVGGGGTVHGGQIATILDTLMGRASLAGGWISRTAYLNVTYRAATPLDEPISVEIRTTSTESRKSVLYGRLHVGGTTLAEGEGLFIQVARYPGAA